MPKGFVRGSLFPLAVRTHPIPEWNTKCLYLELRGLAEQEKSDVNLMNAIKLRLFNRDWIEHGFGMLVNRNIRERRRQERRFVEQRTTKHQLQAMKPCIADARSYRVARTLQPLASARFD